MATIETQEIPQKPLKVYVITLNQEEMVTIRKEIGRSSECQRMDKRMDNVMTKEQADWVYEFYKQLNNYLNY